MVSIMHERSDGNVRVRKHTSRYYTSHDVRDISYWKHELRVQTQTTHTRVTQSLGVDEFISVDRVAEAPPKRCFPIPITTHLKMYNVRWIRDTSTPPRPELHSVE